MEASTAAAAASCKFNAHANGRTSERTHMRSSVHIYQYMYYSMSRLSVDTSLARCDDREYYALILIVKCVRNETGFERRARVRQSRVKRAVSSDIIGDRVQSVSHTRLKAMRSHLIDHWQTGDHSPSSRMAAFHMRSQHTHTLRLHV